MPEKQDHIISIYKPNEEGYTCLEMGEQSTGRVTLR